VGVAVDGSKCQLSPRRICEMTGKLKLSGRADNLSEIRRTW